MRQDLTVVYVVALTALATYLAWTIGVALRAESVFVAASRLTHDPWTWVTIVDLYLGFLVFAGYVVAREGRVGRALPWLVALMGLGNIVSAAYLAWSLHRGGYRLRSLLERADRHRRV